jgi:hypothetical protein
MHLMVHLKTEESKDRVLVEWGTAEAPVVLSCYFDRPLTPCSQRSSAAKNLRGMGASVAD